MNLLLRVVSLNDEPLTQPLIGRFDQRGGDIGRQDSVTFTLPDPERIISRVQARISYGDRGYWIENVAEANPIFHNGRPLSSGMCVALNDRDELVIGGYKLVATHETDDATATILRGRTSEAWMAAPPTGRPVEAQPAAARAAEPVAPPPPHDVVPIDRSAAAAPSGDELWEAFLEGAGIELHLAKGPSRELMRVVGAILRSSVDGIHRLLGLRASTKQEIHADQTMIRMRGNNPLKFAPDVGFALQQLLQPPPRGFLSGQAALHDAINDLESHQVGVLAGMRAALHALLDRFDPHQLERQLASRSVIDSLVPAARRARLWELFLEHYRSLRGEAEDDFDRLFETAFRRAYDEQIKLLQGAQQTAAPPAHIAVEPPRPKH